MNEYAEKKLNYYGRTIKPLVNYRNIVLPIFFILNALGFLGASLSVDLFLRIAFCALAAMAFIFFYFLDGLAFWACVLTASLYAGWQIYNAAVALVLLVSFGGATESALGGLGLGFVAGFGAISGILAAVILLGVAALFSWYLVQFVKQRELFLSSLKELKKKYIGD